ncbi:MAG: HD domain-containing protein [Ginsengibacter sp.]
MKNEEIISATITFVKKELEGAEGGHDWWHIERVLKNAKLIAEGEQVNILVVKLAALLHDIADAKFNDGDENIGPEKARQFLESLLAEKEIITHVENIIRNISFKGGNFSNDFYSPELAVVQDADRLDAMGAIGIARAFNYGGFKNREIYNPSIQPDLQMTKDVYKKSTAPTINHFYEKLLLLKGRMNTETGKKLAEERHQFMETFLKEFYLEWEGKK